MQQRTRPLDMVHSLFLALSLSLLAIVASQSQPALAYQPPTPSPAPPPIMRAWYCHGRNQQELVDRLAQAQIVQTGIVNKVLKMVDRQYYISQNPYQDAPQTLGDGQTISAPHMHAHVLEEMMPTLTTRPTQTGIKVLDVGCGSGYLTACLGRLFSGETPLVKHNGAKVVGIDIIPRLVENSRNNILKHEADLIDSGLVSLHLANGWEGWPAEAPYDVIHVGAAAASFPRVLAGQLKVGGLLIIPIGPNGGNQHLVKVERLGQSTEFDANDYQVTPLLGVRYVPLVQEPE
jgi:protein-L-isoaspartate(D-aspartate) O-methyltransferase